MNESHKIAHATLSQKFSECFPISFFFLIGKHSIVGFHMEMLRVFPEGQLNF